MRFDKQSPPTIQSLFNQIARNYDLINIFMSFGMQSYIKKSSVKNAIKKLGKTPDSVLDICCGTGDISVLFQKYCPNTEVTGIDFSEEMLSIAKEKAPNINFIQGNISQKESIDMERKFDICFISFGLRNLPNIDTFLENAKQYIKDGGILAILDLGKPHLILRPYFYLHYNLIIPLIAKIIHKDIEPYKYLINSAKTYPPQQEIIKKLREHGYTEATNKNFAFGIIASQTAKYSLCGE